jgi:hypothetical protein
VRTALNHPEPDAARFLIESIRESKFRSQYSETLIDKIAAGDVKAWLLTLPLAGATALQIGKVKSICVNAEPALK